jgi:hypothetical protein
MENQTFIFLANIDKVETSVSIVWDNLCSLWGHLGSQGILVNLSMS